MEYVILCAAVLIAWIIVDNRRIKVSHYAIKSSRLPSAFSGLKIAQISDLHGARFGRGNERLLSLISAAEPDIILITGDIINSRNPRLAEAAIFVSQAAKIAPVYFSSGNHESRLVGYKNFRKILEKSGAKVLENETLSIEKNGEFITLLGLTDPRFFTDDYTYKKSLAAIRKSLSEIEINRDSFSIALAHRPELMIAYKEKRLDLVFSGHAHGGQFRLPLLGGLFVPNQGFFPKYDAGHFSDDGTQMLVSRGLGRSIIPVRLFNPPELLIAELTKEAE